LDVPIFKQLSTVMAIIMRKRNNMNTANFSRKRDRKCKEALERQALSAKLSPEERLERLDKLFGEGKGATKERLKLHARLRRQPAIEVVNLHGPSVIETPAEPRHHKPKRRSRNEKYKS
jgi:hypothetical protein